MKNEEDLLNEIIRYCLAGSGAPDSEVDLMLHEIQTSVLAGMKLNPQPLTDIDYDAKFEAMKKEAPAFLHYLLTQLPHLKDRLPSKN